MPNSAVAFAATGVVNLAVNAGVKPETLRMHSYAVMADGRVFLLTSEPDGGHSRLDPVPDAAHESIRRAHPGIELRFPSATTRRIPVDIDDNLVEVDPRRLNLLFGGHRHIAQAELLKGNGDVLDGDWDTPLDATFEEIDNYQGLRQRFIDGVAWEDTPLYARVVREIESGREKWGCRTEEEFRRRCDSLDRLYADIGANGYRTQAELGTTKPDDEIRIGIRRDGRLLFIDGRHRLTIARLLGLERVPVRIVARHAEWVAFKQELLDYANTHRGRIYQQIDHPDLSDIPAQHTTDRIDQLRPVLARYDGTGRRLVDIGCHWGYMSQQFEQLGFDVVAIEANRNNARIATTLGVATESNYRVWKGNLLDFGDIEQQDVVVALNIFHHLIKTEALHEALIGFLRRFNAGLILFEPHRHDPPGQMEGAYRNYAPLEFAEFVANYAGLTTVNQIGQAHDGRLLFSIT